MIGLVVCIFDGICFICYCCGPFSVTLMFIGIDCFLLLYCIFVLNIIMCHAMRIFLGAYVLAGDRLFYFRAHPMEYTQKAKNNKGQKTLVRARDEDSVGGRGS